MNARQCCQIKTRPATTLVGPRRGAWSRDRFGWIIPGRNPRATAEVSRVWQHTWRSDWNRAFVLDCDAFTSALDSMVGLILVWRRETRAASFTNLVSTKNNHEGQC